MSALVVISALLKHACSMEKTYVSWNRELLAGILLVVPSDRDVRRLVNFEFSSNGKFAGVIAD